MKHTFTLIELLMAIGIIVILAAIAIPTTLSAIKKAEVAKAQSEMTALVDALKNYENTYGILPLKCVSGEDREVDGTGTANYDNSLTYPSGVSTAAEKSYSCLIQMLQGKNPELGTNHKKMNPRKIAFLDVQGNEPGVFVDPWGNPYHIVLDGDANGKITSDNGYKGAPGLDWRKNGTPTKYELHTSILIWSDGPDGQSKDNTSESKISDDDKNADNVYSIPVVFDKGTGLWSPTN